MKRNTINIDFINSGVYGAAHSLSKVLKTFLSVRLLFVFFSVVPLFANAVATNCPVEAQGIHNACTFATAGAGTTASPWTGWESGVNGLTTNVEIYFPAGTYQQTSTINTKLGWTIRGAGQNNSLLTAASGFNGTMLKSSSTINGSTAVNLRVEDLYMVSNNVSSTSAGIDITAGSDVTIKRINLYGFAVGIWLDQAEIADVEESVFGATSNSVAGIYLVNGSYHTATASRMFTNRIGIRKNQFNAGTNTAYIGVYDEGGVAHVIRDNNFQSGNHAIWVSSTQDLLIEGNEIEGQTNEPIFFSLTAPNESLTAAYPILNVAIRSNTTAPASNRSSISFPVPSGGNSVAGVTISDNLLGTASGSPVSIAGANNVLYLVAHSNTNIPSSGVYLSDLQSGAFQVLGRMTISTTNALSGTPPNPPANTFYIYVDGNTLKAIGSNGNITTLASP